MAPQRPKRHRPITFATAAGAFSLKLPTASLIRMYSRTGSMSPLIWTGLMSIITFGFYGYDKIQAKNKQWRVKETTLHTLEMLGGWPGALIGQHYFQHKTSKTSFQVGFWGIIVAWQIACFAIWRSGELPSMAHGSPRYGI
ncbi:DUF1294-domain-containing protein [Aaosphaeria arxii CBS 175.79]|uniref:DUF1294-domain-containing protein n=1 Tax=Aaosphaeria arxii CBS 175.79 TaxID=1450172 RepID=A0A6A5XK15_9PLEO|nr:DUF1294-domain-containing protein [Aaosphaeria arxii CBS 175.79]KAF2013472.1 DUF1294-domain-containing protein [Aaosphaeria arxii CBS 175.79]